MSVLRRSVVSLRVSFRFGEIIFRRKITYRIYPGRERLGNRRFFSIKNPRLREGEIILNSKRTAENMQFFAYRAPRSRIEALHPFKTIFGKPVSS